MKERTTDRDKPVSFKSFLRQLQAIKAWGRQAPQPLDIIRTPVLVINGDHDIMVPSQNSAELARRIGQQAAAKVRAQFGWGKVADEFTALCEKALQLSNRKVVVAGAKLAAVV